MSTYPFHIIGTVHSCFKQKFGIPRQPGLAPDAEATLIIQSPYGSQDAFKGIENYSHLWVFFLFHATVEHSWHATVRPPRLGGDQRIGVFASRSNFRPNPIGLSLVEFSTISFTRGVAKIKVKNHDLLDGSPILDIKPYIVFSDARMEAKSFPAPEYKIKVEFSNEFIQKIKQCSTLNIVKTCALLTQMTAQDPRPAYRFGAHDSNTYAIILDSLEYHFHLPSIDTACFYDVTRPFAKLKK